MSWKYGKYCTPLPSMLAVVFAFVSSIGCSDSADHRRGDVLGSPVRDGGDAGEANEARVSMVEFQIEMPATISSGLTRFVVTNNGEVLHNLKIEGGDVDRVLSDAHLKPGEQGAMEVYLAPGSYTVYCPVFNHRNRGMQRTLTVTGG